MLLTRNFLAAINNKLSRFGARESVNKILWRQTLRHLAQDPEFIRNPTVYDVGAHEGCWTSSLREQFPNVTSIMFEANPAHEERLRRLGYRYFIGCLHSEAGRRVSFNLPDNPSVVTTGASLYREKTKHYTGARQLDLNSWTLDQLIQDNALPLPTLIKLDTQGSELDILRGGSALFGPNSPLHWVYIEIPLTEYNDGAPCTSEYIKFCSSRGYLPVAISEMHERDAQLVQVDVLFGKRTRAE